MKRPKIKKDLFRQKKVIAREDTNPLIALITSKRNGYSPPTFWVLLDTLQKNEQTYCLGCSLNCAMPSSHSGKDFGFVSVMSKHPTPEGTPFSLKDSNLCILRLT